MFSLFFSEYLDQCVEALLNSSDQRIQNVIETIRQNEESYEETIRELVYQFTIHHIEDFSEPERLDDLLQEYIIHLGRFLEKTQRVYIIEVRLRGLEQELWRLLRVPASLTVADLCYLVFASMRLSNGKEYLFGHRNQLFYGGEYIRISPFVADDEILTPAFLCPLALLKLHKNSKMSLLYDVDEGFIFELVVKEVIQTDGFVDDSLVRIIAGQGVGVLNLSHEELENVFQKWSDFSMSDLLEPTMSLFAEMLDLKSMNAVLIKQLEQFRDIYEAELIRQEDDDDDELIAWFC